MDSTPIAPATGAELKADNTVPAGSTLLLPSGVHVPHPRATPNLPGAGDPRLGDTEAITETSDGVQHPLYEEVKPKVLTVAPGAKKAELPKEAVVTPISPENPGVVAVEQPTLAKVE